MRRNRGRPLGSLGRLGLAALVGSVLAAGVARANGAFPDEFSIHFPANAPHRIYVGANFGLLVSEDDGATWRYSCEPWVTEGSSAALTQNNVDFYQLTAGGALIAQSLEVTRSEDAACTWPVSGGVITGRVVTDVFPDPNDPTLVLAVIVGTGGSDIVASHDGGKTFVDPPIHHDSGLITGLELAKSQPGVIYATSVPFSGSGSTLARSDDYGAHWTPWPLANPVGSEPLIMAIDPEDADTVYLRVVGGLTDSVVITQNGGQSFDTPLTINGQFSSFLRATDRSLYVGAVAGRLYVRAPGATAFTDHAAPHFRCLGQRPGTSRIFACGDMGIDGFSVGYSDNGGQTFQPMMSFTDLLGPLTCPSVANNCAAHWQRIQGVLGITPPPDGGTVGPPDAGSPDAGSPDAGTPPPSNPGGQKSGCSTTDGNPVLILGLIVVLLLWRVRP
jgi:photosystem II stability/assembly factor-like uncharacterized protein